MASLWEGVSGTSGLGKGAVWRAACYMLTNTVSLMGPAVIGSRIIPVSVWEVWESRRGLASVSVV